MPMDPLSIVSSVTAVATLSYSVSTTLYSFITAAKAVNESINSLYLEVKTLSTAISSIETQVKNPSVRQATSTRLWDDIAANLDACSITLRKFKCQLDSLPPPSQGKARAFFRVAFRQYKLGLRSEDVDHLRSQLQSHQMTLQLLYSTLTVDTLTPKAGLAADMETLTPELNSLNDKIKTFILPTKLRANTSDGYIVQASERLKNTARAISSNASEGLGSSTVYGDYSRDSEPRNSVNYKKFDQIKEWKDTASVIEEEFDSDDELVAEITNNFTILGKKKFQNKEYAEAEKLLRRAQDGLKTNRGLEKEQNGVSVRALDFLIAESCLHQDKLDDAKVIYERLRRDLTSSKEDQKTSLKISLMLSKAYLRAGELPTASHQCRRTVLGLKKLEGTSSTYYEAVSLMVVILSTQGDSDQSAAWELMLPDNYETPSFKGPIAQTEALIKATNNGDSDDDTLNEFNKPDTPADTDQKATCFKASKTVQQIPDQESLVETLVSAISNQQPDKALDAIRQGSSVNVPNKDGYLPLERACEQNSKQLVSLLLDNGADIEASGVYPSPLLCAVQHSNDTMIELLVQRGADINRQFPSHPTFSSAIIEAAWNLDLKCINKLINLKADTGVTDKHRRGVLHILAIASHSKSGRNLHRDDLEETLRLLMAAGIDVNQTDNLGYTPLDDAHRRGPSEVGFVLRKFGAISKINK